MTTIKQKKQGSGWVKIQTPQDLRASIQRMLNKILMGRNPLDHAGAFAQLANAWTNAYKAEMSLIDVKKLKKRVLELENLKQYKETAGTNDNYDRTYRIKLNNRLFNKINDMISTVEGPNGLKSLSVAYGIAEGQRHILEPTIPNNDVAEIDRLIEVIAGRDPKAESLSIEPIPPAIKPELSKAEESGCPAI